MLVFHTRQLQHCRQYARQDAYAPDIQQESPIGRSSSSYVNELMQERSHDHVEHSMHTIFSISTGQMTNHMLRIDNHNIITMDDYTAPPRPAPDLVSERITYFTFQFTATPFSSARFPGYLPEHLLYCCTRAICCRFPTLAISCTSRHGPQRMRCNELPKV